MVTGGVALALAGTAAYTQITAGSPYWYLAGALLLIGAGLGAPITPSMAAAFPAVDRPAIPAATAAIGTIQCITGSLGTVLLAVTLQHAISARIPGYHGGITQAATLAATSPVCTLPARGSAFGVAFRVAAGSYCRFVRPRAPAARPPGGRARSRGRLGRRPPAGRAGEPREVTIRHRISAA